MMTYVHCCVEDRLRGIGARESEGRDMQVARYLGKSQRSMYGS
jgi:hypothetical protein